MTENETQIQKIEEDKNINLIYQATVREKIEEILSKYRKYADQEFEDNLYELLRIHENYRVNTQKMMRDMTNLVFSLKNCCYSVNYFLEFLLKKDFIFDKNEVIPQKDDDYFLLFMLHYTYPGHTYKEVAEKILKEVKNVIDKRWQIYRK